MKKTYAIAALALSLAITNEASSQYRGATYFVDSITGNDNNNGSSPTTALKTLQAGVRKLNPAGGDTLVIRGTFKEIFSTAASLFRAAMA